MIVFVVVVLFVLLFGAGVALAWWARWLSGRYGAPRILGPLAMSFLAIPIVIIAVDVWTILSMRTVVAGDELDPSQKARLLAEGISELMNGTALAAPLFFIAICLMLFLTWRYHWSAKTPKPEGEPPYR